MSANRGRALSSATGLVVFVFLGSIFTVRAAGPASGLPTDWSHRHLVFSRPATAERARRVAGDPRYEQQWARRSIRTLGHRASAASKAHLQAPSVSAQKNQGAPRDWSENLGFDATVGPDNFPAKYAFQVTTALCGDTPTPDYVVFNTGLSGSTSQASVVALDNLYSGCGGTVPNIYWAYNTGGQVLTSITPSEDGSQIAFAQTNSNLEGTLILLKWAAASGTVSAPLSLQSVSNVAYRSCAAPCMTSIELKDSQGNPIDDRISSVFPDYTGDVLWVGGTSGWLCKISGAFRGSPAEVIDGTFPVQVNSLNPTALSSPVYDYSSGNVFVGDVAGYLYRVDTATGDITASGRLDYGTGLITAPTVDSTAGNVYVFSSSDGSANCPNLSSCNAVYLLGTSFAEGSTGAKVTVGSSSINSGELFEGDFDSNYWNSSDATGNLYVCGNTAGAPTIYQLPIDAGVLSLANAGPVLSHGETECSPITDIANPNAPGGAAEWIFASVQSDGAGNSCGSTGCVMNLTVQPWNASTYYAVGQEVLDPNLHIQVVRSSGTSGTNSPSWSANPGGATGDGSVTWLNQGSLSAFHLTWQPDHGYAAGAEILDSNGNMQLLVTGGVSGKAHPIWATNLNGTTEDATLRWRNLGPTPTASLPAGGGTSGIILDNTLGASALSGASQIYYSTLANQNCGISGTGGCAVQTSQSQLQ